MQYLYTVSQKKEATKLSAITFSNLNRFSKLFHCWIEDEYLQKKLCNIFHHTLTMFLHYLGKVNSSNLLQILKKMQQENLIFEHI